MNANWMPANGAAAGAIVMALCLGSFADAQLQSGGAPQPTVTRSSDSPPLTRGDVDRLLDEARQAIADGNLDRAEALLARAESVHVRYPLFHMGPTPASVRRELTDARNSSRYAQHTQTLAEPLSTPDDRISPPADPFAERPMPLPAGPPTQPLPPNLEGNATPPVVPALFSHPVGEQDRAVRTATATMPDAPMPPGLRAAGDGGNPWSSVPADSPQPELVADTNANIQKARALELLQDARHALAAGDLDQAEAAAREATALNVPESAFLPHEERPSMVMWDIRRARGDRPSPPPVAEPHGPTGERYASTANLDPTTDTSRNVPAATEPLTLSDLRFAQLPEPIELPPEDAAKPAEVLPAPTAPLAIPPTNARNATRQAPTPPPAPETLTPSRQAPESEAARLLAEGQQALADHDRRAASRLFGQAYVLRDQLTSDQQNTLEEHLQMLASTAAADPTGPTESRASLIDEAAEDEQALARQMSAEVGRKQSDARRLRETEPQQALKMLQDARQSIADSQLSEQYRNQLFRRIDITIAETEKYIEDHAAEIELDQKNKAVLDEVERQREVKLKVQQKIAELVDEFNRLRDEQRYPEMEVVARRLIEMAPDEPVAQQVWQNAKFIRRTINNQQLADAREDANWNALNDVETASIQNVGDGRELVYNEKQWNALVKNRKAGDRETRRTERELEIERRLKTPVLLRYENMPLSEVMQGLSELAGVNIHLDPRGLSQEGVETSTPVTVNLSKEISLKSALNLILEPLHLSYVVTDEVLKVTSEQLRDGEIYSKVYNVADLVIPIPNFVPNNNIGLQGLINDAHQTIGYGQGGLGLPGPTVLVNNDRGPNGQPLPQDQNVLAQQFGAAGNATTGSSLPMGTGPGGLGGGANADFDSLIDLIVSTVATETWAENGGGEAEIRPFPTNLSLVISQTQAVHEEIADLLEQLRRLQDLQVTIEVRFIRLNDRFFERIGIDFQMDIGPPASPDVINPDGTPNESAPSSIVGLQFPVPPTNPFPNFTSDLEVPFRQVGFELTRPVFGGPPAQLSSFGFAILSEIEAYFLIEAAQGDSRTNVLNAPKVTLFNGQQAFVADAISQPFVIGVIPVVGEFAAAQQPVIVVLNEGTMMSIQAVVSNDRRYVRLTVVPFFTQVGDVDTFTFEGSTSSSSSSSSSSGQDENGENESEEEEESEVRSGVTVQLPSFQFVAVVTTVSVPDGGTVLLGGIKRLSEGRNEFGIPLLSKVPYINRLFRNVGIGRETDSLMMMVTPRIIIQEEEEERLGITAVP